MKLVKVLFRNNRDQNYFLISGIIILCFYLPFLIFGKDSVIRIHDNLDSNLVWIKILTEANLSDILNPNFIFSDYLSGISRASLYPYFNFTLLVFALFGTYWGYIISRIIMTIIAYFGMYLLLKNIGVKSVEYNSNELVVINFIALIYSLIPFWSFDISVAGLPMLFFCFHRLLFSKYDLVYYYLFIIFYSFYSSLILVGFFIVVLLIIYLIYLFIKTNRINKKLIIILIVLSFGYSISHYPLIYQLLIDSDFISHRFNSSIQVFSNEIILKNLFYLFTEGQIHTYSVHILFIPIVFWYFYKNPKLVFSNNYLVVAFKLIVFFCFIYALWNSQFLNGLLNKIYSIIPFDFSRFYFLNPFLWYFLIASIIVKILNKNNYGIFLFLLSSQIFILFLNNDMVKYKDSPTFNQFYDVSNFKKIKTIINNEQNSKSIAIGIEPAVLHYNNISSFDGYFPNYSKDHKLIFRKIISGELNRDASLLNYFDDWGSRCYAYSSELGKNLNNTELKVIQNLNFDYDLLISKGVKYLISSKKINLKNVTRLVFINQFESEYYNKIYLYKII